MQGRHEQIVGNVLMRIDLIESRYQWSVMRISNKSKKRVGICNTLEEAQRAAESVNEDELIEVIELCPVKQFVDKECLITEKGVTTQKELYKRYELWIKQNRKTKLSSALFSRLLGKYLNKTHTKLATLYCAELR